MKIGIVLAAFLMVFTPVVEQEGTFTEKATNTTFDKVMGDSPPLKLLGVAPRTKWFFKIYGVGLYADLGPVKELLGDGPKTQARIAAAIISSKGKKVVVLKFVRSLNKGKLTQAFRDGIELSMPFDDPRIKDDVKKFLDSFDDVKKGEIAEMHFEGDEIVMIGIDLEGVSEEMVRLNNKSLSRAIISMYIGVNPLDENIKRKLLTWL